MEIVLNGKKRSLASHTALPVLLRNSSAPPYPTASGLAFRLHRPDVHGCPPGALRNLVMAVCYTNEMTFVSL